MWDGFEKTNVERYMSQRNLVTASGKKSAEIVVRRIQMAICKV